jgi:tRNA uridine 5-carboxymethylaminomethyl modification enzyme
VRSVLHNSSFTLRSVLHALPELRIEDDLITLVEVECRYAQYLAQQQHDIDTYRRNEGMHIPSIDYRTIPISISNEERSKLATAMPPTLAAAAQIEGIRPSSLLSLFAYLRRLSKPMP